METPQSALEAYTHANAACRVLRAHIWRATAVLSVALVACSVYANVSFTFAGSQDHEYFSFFQPFFDLKNNRHLGAEYFNIAEAIVEGHGFADPFGERTGPTAWMPPVLPTILAGLLRIAEGNRDVVAGLVVILQVSALIGTGIMIIAIAQRTSTSLGSWTPALVFLIWVINDFYLWFQMTHDTWLVLLAADVFVASLCFYEPWHTNKAAALWGLCGGIFALINPVLLFAWGTISLALAIQRRTVSRFAVAALVAAAVVAPWMVRNYSVFGRLIPVKSNLAYELYQSQCLDTDGLLQYRVIAVHPYNSAGPGRQEYVTLGEMAFLDHKWELFRQRVVADPMDFVDRLLDRFIGATVWYTPLDRSKVEERPWVYTWARLIHPLPFLALVLMVTVPGIRSRLCSFQWAVMGVYVFYLLPYVIISYYDRYAVPLVGVKALMVLWAAGFLLDFIQRRRKMVFEKAGAIGSFPYESR